MNGDLTCFKSYDIRGDLTKNFDSDICYRIGRSFAMFLKAQKVVVGRDARESSPKLLDSVCRGLMDEGVNVLDIGLAGTEEMYWATTQYRASGGIEVTASHNPINYNGMKIIKSNSRPLVRETDFPINFFNTGSFVKYLPNINASPNNISVSYTHLTLPTNREV